MRPLAAALALVLAWPRQSHALEGCQFLGEQALGLKEPAAIAGLGESGFVVFDREACSLVWLDAAFQPKTTCSLRDIPGLKVRDLRSLTFSPHLKRVFALDSRGRQILVFDVSGRHERVISLSIERAGTVAEPAALAVDPAGRIYVSDVGAGDIKVFNLQGLYLFPIVRSTGPDGQPVPLTPPACLALQADGSVAVLELDNHGLRIFSRQGERVGGVRLEGTYRNLKGLALTSSGEYLAFDDRERKVYRWDAAGQLTALFGVRGAGRGQFDELADIASDEKGNIVALDSGTKTAKRFGFRTPLLPASAPLPALNSTVTFLETESVGLAPVAILTNGAVFFDPERKRVHVRLDGAERLVEHADFRRVTAACVDADLLCVFDASRRKVFVFRTRDLTLAYEFGGSGRGDGSLDDVVRILPGPKDTWYLADAGAARVHVFSRDGVFCTRFGGKGDKSAEQIGRLADIAWFRDQLAVLDGEKNRIHFFDADGRLLRSAPVRVPQADPEWSCLGADPHGLLLLLDRRHCRLFVVNDEGDNAFSFGSAGTRDFDWRRPGSFLADGRGRFKIVDRGDDVSRILAYDLRTADPLERIEEAVAEIARTQGNWSPIRDMLKPYLSRIGAGPTAEPADDRLARIALTANVAAGGMFLSTQQLETAHAVLKEQLKTRAEDGAGRFALASSLKAAGRLEEAITVLRARPATPPEPRCEALQEECVRKLAASGHAQAKVAIASCEIPDLFPALAPSYYDEPVIRLTLQNSGGEASAPGKALFFARAVMDNATETRVPAVPPFSSATILLPAALNRNVLTYVEASRLGAQLEVRLGAPPGESVLTENLTFQLLGRNAVDWKRGAMIACFVTPKDPDVQVFARQALKAVGTRPVQGDIDEHLYRALTLFDALQTVGLYYQPDPRQPFNYSKMSKEKLIDYVQFPAETLRRQSGDCDDLAVLYAALLESAGIPTVLVTSPGHIFVAFALKKGRTCADALGLSPDLLIERGGEFFVPVETTLLNNPFISAWRVAAGLVAQHAPGKQIGFIDLKEVWQTLKVASLPPQEKEVPLPSSALLGTLLHRELDALNLKQVEKRLAIFRQWLQDDPGNVDLMIFLARSYGEIGLFDAAKDYAEQARKRKPDSPTVCQVFGNLSYLQNDFGEAVRWYLAADKMEHSAAVQINLAMAYLKKGDLLDARKAYAEARRLDAKAVEEYPELKQLLE